MIAGTIRSGDLGLFGLAFGLLVLLVWLFRELAWARRWHDLIDAVHRLCDVLDRFELVIYEDDDGPPAPGSEPIEPDDRRPPAP